MEEKKPTKPTEEFYLLFQFLFDFLNKELFDNTLPQCMIVITRKSNTFGHFQPERWINDQKEKSDEIAINPFYFDRYPLIEILQTLVHEMCHSWQFNFGKPSNKSYHNKEWSEKMQSIGLMPSNTGKPEGKKTGQHMLEYPIEKGNFVKASNKLIKQRKFKSLWYDRVKKEKEVIKDDNSSIEDSDDLQISQNEVYDNLSLDNILLEIPTNNDLEIISTNKKGKGKYKCFNCELTLWGKKELNIICGECNDPFTWCESEETEKTNENNTE